MPEAAGKSQDVPAESSTSKLNVLQAKSLANEPHVDEDDDDRDKADKSDQEGDKEGDKEGVHDDETAMQAMKKAPRMHAMKSPMKAATKTAMKAMKEMPASPMKRGRRTRVPSRAMKVDTRKTMKKCAMKKPGKP